MIIQRPQKVRGSPGRVMTRHATRENALLIECLHGGGSRGLLESGR